jgi:signal transduction histidine kinase
MLTRLGIRQKLGLLLAIPLVAVVLVLVPFMLERIDDARSAGTTATTASAARQIGGLLESLQQERLLTVGYLSVPALDRSTLVAQSQTAIDDASRLRADPSTADVLAAAGPALGYLASLRQAVLDRAVSAVFAYQAFRDADAALLDALRLANPAGADAAGLTQLDALDELMRSNEEASSVGAVLVAAAADPTLPRNLLTDAVTADQQHQQRFRRLVSGADAGLIDGVDNGEAGRRISQIVDKFSQLGAPASVADVSDALTAAVAYTDLRRFVQDRVAREVATEAQSRATAAGRTATGVTVGAAALLVLVVGLGLAVSRSISRPLRRLTRAAAVVAELSTAELDRVADSDSYDAQAPQLAAVEVGSTDEIGELAQAINQVQASAAQLLERQVSTRRNVGVMFTNIARRTQNLVGRQLGLIDDLERNETNPGLLQGLYRLDHVATRLRRSADSLLVVSGTIEQSLSGGPTPLADVVRSALAEIEGYEVIDIGQVAPVAVTSSLAADLRLMLAELLENATNFSPPGSRVAVSASVDGDCRIAIIDHGLGLGQARLEEENRRLLERERLDVAPSNVLGLFVVGRLARRHGLSVRLNHTDPRGITAVIWIPCELLAEPRPGIPGTLAGRIRPLPARHRAEVALFDAFAPDPDNPFPWFEVPTVAARTARATAPVSRASSPVPSARPRARSPMAAADARPAPAATHGPPAQTAAGLARRVPGTHLTPGDGLLPDRPATRARRDPEAERDLLNDYLSGFTKATDDGGPVRPNLAERHS